jgi:predicted nucleic acid-binding protein
MILLDSDVLSSLMQESRDEVIVKWLNSQPPSHLCTTSITIFEIRTGISLLPQGHRRRRLETALENALVTVLSKRVLPFDSAAALRSANLASERKSRGLNVGFADTMIAGIALAVEAKVATGNVKHFRDLGAHVINPWHTMADDADLNY